MLGYLSLDILFLEVRSFPRKTVRFSEQIMSADKYPSICSRQMKAIVYVYIYIHPFSKTLLNQNMYIIYIVIHEFVKRYG